MFDATIQVNALGLCILIGVASSSSAMLILQAFGMWRLRRKWRAEDKLKSEH